MLQLGVTGSLPYRLHSAIRRRLRGEIPAWLQREAARA